MSRIIGIDLGTTNTLASCWQDGKSVLIPNRFGDYITPSVVSIDENGTVYTVPEETKNVYCQYAAMLGVKPFVYQQTEKKKARKK